MRDYWQPASKVKKINQISGVNPLAGSRKNRKTERLLDVGIKPADFVLPSVIATVNLFILPVLP